MIKFNVYNVQDTETGKKAKVWYSFRRTVMKDGVAIPGYVEVVAKEYGHDLDAILPGVTNDTDTQTDYFAKSRVRLYEDNPLYSDALAALVRERHARDARAAKRLRARLKVYA